MVNVATDKEGIKLPKRWTLTAIWYHSGMPQFMAPSQRVAYALQLAFQALVRGRLSSMMSIMALSLILAVVCGFLLAMGSSIVMLRHTKEEVAVNVFFKDSASSISQSNAIKRLRKHFPTLDVVYVDGQVAARAVQEFLGTDLLINSSSLPNKEDVLPASLEIIIPGDEGLLSTVSALRGVSESISSLEGFFYNHEQAARVQAEATGRGRKLLRVSATTVAVFVAGVCLIALLARLSLHARRKELQTSYLMGAQGAALWLPFFLEMLLTGLVSGFLGSAVLWLLREDFLIWSLLGDVIITEQGNWLLGIWLVGGASLAGLITAVASMIAWHFFEFSSE